MLAAYTATNGSPSALQIRSINPSALGTGALEFMDTFSAKDLNSMTAKQLAQFADFSDTTNPTTLAELKPSVLQQVNANVIKNLADTEKAALTPAQIKVLSADKVEMLINTAGTGFAASDAAINALSAAQIKALHNGGSEGNALSLFTDAQLAALNGSALRSAGLTPAQQLALFDTPAEQISDKNIGGLSKEVLMSTTFTALTTPVAGPSATGLVTNDGLKSIAPKLLASLGDTMLDTLTPTQIAALTPLQQAALPIAQLTRGTDITLTVEMAKKLTATELQKMTTLSVFTNASDEAKAAISAAALSKLSATQAPAFDATILSAAQIKAIPPDALIALANISDLDHIQIKALTPAQITKLASVKNDGTPATADTLLKAIIDSATDTSVLSVSQIRALTKEAIADLDTMVADFTAAQWKAISATAITGLTNDAATAMDAVDTAALTAVQLKALASIATTTTADDDAFELLDFGKVTGATMNQLGRDAILKLNNDQLGELSVATLNGMSKTALGYFSNDQEAAFPVATLVGVKTHIAGYITDDGAN